MLANPLPTCTLLFVPPDTVEDWSAIGPIWERFFGVTPLLDRKVGVAKIAPRFDAYTLRETIAWPLLDFHAQYPQASILEILARTLICFWGIPEQDRPDVADQINAYLVHQGLPRRAGIVQSPKQILCFYPASTPMTDDPVVIP